MSHIVGQVQESIKEEITCHICLQLMDDPRALPCTHVYCKKCLQGVLNRDLLLSTTLRCPECRREAQVRGNNVDSLTRDFRTVRLRTLYDKLQSQCCDDAASEPESSCQGDLSSKSVDNTVASICDAHHNSLTVYCITCKDVICQECESAHINHNYHRVIKENAIRKQFNEKLKSSETNFSAEKDIVNSSSVKKPKSFLKDPEPNTASDAERLREVESSETNLSYNKAEKDIVNSSSVKKPKSFLEDPELTTASGTERLHKVDPVIQKQLDKILSKVSKIEPKLSEALVEATKVHSEVEHRAYQYHVQIDAIFEGMIQLLNEKRHHLHGEIVGELRKKRDALVPQKEQLTTAYRDLATLADQCRSGTVRDQGSASQLSLQFEQVSDRTKQLSLEPAETVDIGNSLTKETATKSCCKSCMFKVHIPDMNKCKVDGNFLEHPEATDKEFHLRLQVCEGSGQPCTSRYIQVEGKLVCTKDKSENIARTICVDKGTFHLYFATANRGRHTLNIRVNHILISQCPIPLFVEKRPQTYSAPVNQIENLNGPTGLQISKQNLVVSEEYSFTVSMYNRKGTRTASLEMGGEFAADTESKHYFVANTLSHQLFKFNSDGVRLIRESSQGRMPGQFQTPGGMDFHDGQLFVTDSGNHRIQVFDKDLNLIRHFGQEGVKNGYFNYPRDVVVDSNGDLYVTDMLNNRIQVLTKTGLFIRNISKETKQRIYPRTPCKLQIHRDHVFVTEHHSNSVCVFMKSGDFVTTFGEAYLVYPDGIAINEDGYVFVSSNKEKILVF